MKSLTTLFMLTATTVAATLTSSSPKHFRLKSSGATNQEHNNLYVFAHHTGAGLNDAVLTKDVNNASSVYLNDTKALFDFDSKSPRGVVATGDIKKASWDPITQAKEVMDSHSRATTSSGRKPAASVDGSLFYLNRYYDATTPTSCSKIQLKAEFIK
ncbi:hypothetical protein E8E15_000614 [Penicillium rubens]|nr:hypothetical protein E8E15_000614 [Penicillium rubens]KAJ5037733.1 hypothetical protein NUH16_011332 [Penicillium rubens]